MKTLRERCVNDKVNTMTSNIEGFGEMWNTMDTCYERPDKSIWEALHPAAEFRKYKVSESEAIREFYSQLRAAIKGARVVGHLKLLITEQTLSSIMGKMPSVDWKQWAVGRLIWLRDERGVALESFMEQKWRNDLNLVTAEPAG